MRKKLLIVLGLILLVSVAAYGFLSDRQDSEEGEPTIKTSQTTKAPTPVKTEPEAFNKTQFSLTDPTSVWVVVNKQRALTPQNYAPTDLVGPGVPLRTNDIKVRQEVAMALQQLFAAASANGTPLKVSSGYRSYNYQVGLYNGYVSKEGQVAADAESARPGFSEHQTGLAADLAAAGGGCNIEQCFGSTSTGKWLAAEGYKHGFIIRYPEGKTSVTGYSYEPWHVRYVGVALATEMHNKGILTLEEFFGLPAAPSY